MVSIDRVVIAIHNLPRNEGMEEKVRGTLNSLPCIGVRPDWVFFQYPALYRSKEAEVQIYMESMEREKIDHCLQGMIEAAISIAFEPFTNGQSVKVKTMPFCPVSEFLCSETT